MSKPAPEPLSLQFVVGNNPEQLKSANIKQAKSHVSKVGWKVHFKNKPRVTAEEAAEARRRRRRQNAEGRIECELINRTPADSVPGVLSSGECFLLALSKSSSGSNTPPGDFQLGGGRLDPFSAYPGKQNAIIPGLVDHYLVHMAVDIPELDQPGNKGLLRSSWFPLVISDLAIFQTILLLSASNAASIKNDLYSRSQVLRLKADAIQSINMAVTHESQWTSDAIIGAVAKMAGFEAMHGNLESYRMHMAGLVRILELRGGLNSLGLGGLLRRIIVWIDLNSAFLLNVDRYFPRHTFEGEVEIDEPNLENFLAP